MFVSRLDRDWLDTPFLMQGFMVETLEHIDILVEYCKHVWVDAVEDGWVPLEDGGKLKRQSRSSRYINKVDTQLEHHRARGVYREARRITKNLLDEVRLGGAVDTENAKSTVSHCVDSILRNPDALLWMSKMRNQDEYTAEHCLNVCILTIAFGRHLGLPKQTLHQLGLCGLLHDVGKMRIATEILNKPGALTEKEFRVVKGHTIHGRNLLMSSSGLYHGVVDVAYSHHEKLDGTGYPRKLKATSISEQARIVAIVDAYDAMTADRCYAPAMTSTDALKIIFKDRGYHFDEQLALKFIETVGLYPPGSIVELCNGQVGLVLTVNNRYRHLPKVMTVLDEDKQPKKEKVLDLSAIESGELSRDFLIKRVLKDGSHSIRIRDFRDKGLHLSQPF